MKKKTIVWLLIVVGLFITLSASGYAWQKSTNRPSYETFEVKRGELRQEVSSTGVVKSAKEVALSFETSGKIAAVLVGVGDAVAKNQVIARLDSKELQTQLNQAKAVLEREIAGLNKLLAGPSPEKLSFLETKIANAKITLQDKETDFLKTQEKATTDLANVYLSAKNNFFSSFTTADNVLNKLINELFINGNTSSPILSFSTNNSQQAQNTENERMKANTTLANLKQIAQNPPNEQTAINIDLNNTENNLTTIKNFLDLLAETLNNAIGLTSDTLTTYKGYVNTARSNINSEISSINSQKQSINSQKATNQSALATAQAAINAAKNNLILAEKELALEKAEPTAADLQSQEAQIKSAQANVENLQIRIEKTYLRAPLAGVITKQLAKVGENATANFVLAEIATKNNLEVETLVNEIDIAKIKLNQSGQITLDAFGDDIIFDSEVIFIDSTQTTIQDVVYYKVKLAFSQENENVKPGMTADVSICANKKDDVLFIPPRTVKTSNGEKYVEILINKKSEKQLVETGIRGNEGIEILSGLQEGDLVITFVNAK